MIYTVSKKLLIITSIIWLLLSFWCTKKQIKIDWDNNIIQTQTTWTSIWIQTTWAQQNDVTPIKTDTLLTNTWDIKVLIEEYKAKNTWDNKNRNENDVELLEKLMEKIENK